MNLDDDDDDRDDKIALWSIMGVGLGAFLVVVISWVTVVVYKYVTR